jgi:hypothetical protein
MLNWNEEFPSSFELWEFVLSFEDGSLPASAWDERALAVVAIWYLFLLPPADAIARLEVGLRRNQLRFAHRPGALGDGIADAAEMWPCVLRHVLATVGEQNPLSAANWLMKSRGLKLEQDRAA